MAKPLVGCINVEWLPKESATHTTEPYASWTTGMNAAITRVTQRPRRRRGQSVSQRVDGGPTDHKMRRDAAIYDRVCSVDYYVRYRPTHTAAARAFVEAHAKVAEASAEGGTEVAAEDGEMGVAGDGEGSPRDDPPVSSSIEDLRATAEFENQTLLRV